MHGSFVKGVIFSPRLYSRFDTLPFLQSEVITTFPICWKRVI